MTKRILIGSAIMAALLLFIGCSYKASSTPAAMSHDSSSVDYSKITEMKSAKV